MQDFLTGMDLMNPAFGGEKIFIIVIFLAIRLLLVSIVCWVNFDQIRQLGKLYKEIKPQIGKVQEYENTKLMISNFDGIVLSIRYILVMGSVFLLGSVLGLYIGFVVTAIIQLFLLYFPVWKLTKSDGLTASQIKRWSIINKVLFVWVCIKVGLIALVTILGTLAIILASCIN